jgi:hypothetical protein
MATLPPCRLSRNSGNSLSACSGLNRDSFIANMELRYQGRWNPAMMMEYCWFLCREDEISHKRSNHKIIKLITLSRFFIWHLNNVINILKLL